MLVASVSQRRSRSSRWVSAIPSASGLQNANTLYVADEGYGYAGGTDLYTHELRILPEAWKWVFNASTKTWQMAYVLKNGLGIGTPRWRQVIRMGNNSATKLPWAPATDGLRNITGLVGPDGLVAIYAVTSTVSGNGDQGADHNRLFVVVDYAPNTDSSVAAGLPFFEVRDAQFGEVLRGVSLTPGTDFSSFRTFSEYNCWQRRL